MNLRIDCCDGNCLLALHVSAYAEANTMFDIIVCYGNWPGSLMARDCFMYYNDPFIGSVGIVIT